MRFEIGKSLSMVDAGFGEGHEDHIVRFGEDGVDEVLGADIGRTESACGKECCREDILRSGREGK